MDDNADGLNIGVSEMNRNLKLQYEGVDSLKATARSVLAAASLITGLMALLQLVRPIQSDYFGLFSVAIGITMVLYVLLIVACVASISALTLAAPVNANWNEIQQFFAGKTGTELADLQIATLLNAIKANEPIIARQRVLVLTACWILPAIVVILLALSLIPR
ncbi:MAG: hypothetical protein ACOYBO_00975 [Azonexus sp.]